VIGMMRIFFILVLICAIIIGINGLIILEKNQKKAEDKANEMCKKLLANLVIEDYKIIGSQ